MTAKSEKRINSVRMVQLKISLEIRNQVSPNIPAIAMQ
jgi:hypothetical protein